MRWVSAIVLRLALGLSFGFAGLIGVWLLIYPGSHLPIVSPSMMLFIPMVGGMGLAMLLVDGIQLMMWKRQWRRIVDPSREIPFDSARAVRRAVRSFSGVSALPTIADRRVEKFIRSLSTTMLQKQVREEWVWEIYQLAWPHIRKNPALLDETRAVFKSCERLTETAWQVGLALLKERPGESGLAIRLAKESMTRELINHPHEQLTILENAWVTAYLKTKELRPVLLSPLTRRFLITTRRDEIAGRIYIGAFVNLASSQELISEMKRTADALESTGSDPELIANLRALASDENREADTPPETATTSPEATSTTFAPFSDSEQTDFDIPFPDTFEDEGGEEITTSEVADITDDAIQFAFDGGAETDPPVEADELLQPAGSKKPHRQWIWFAAGIIVAAVLVAGAFQVFDLGSLITGDTEAITSPASSLLPYTIQVSALPTRARAVDLIRTLRDHDLDAYLVISTRNDRTWYRVHFGYYLTVEEADSVAKPLVENGVIDGYYVARFEPGEIPEELDYSEE